MLAGCKGDSMDTAIQVARNFGHVYLALPLITQWAVTILLIAGFVIHILAYNERTAHDAPSLFTTAGIFFTFLGIAEGLFAFNPNAIDLSVPALLDGLKTAFIASVVGVGLALSIKLRLALFDYPIAADGQALGPVTIDNLHSELVGVRQALIGTDEGTLLSQLKLSRQDVNDRLDALKKSQADFLQQMAASNTEALIEALEEVIRDFNVKISEQFGENFKQLNLAVGRLLDWQQNYRNQLDQLIQTETTSAENMKSAVDSFTTLSKNAESFDATSKSLAALLAGLEVQRNHIEGSMRSLGELLSRASDSIPQIENKIMQITDQMTFGVKAHQDEITKAIKNTSVALEGSIDNIKQLLLQATQSQNQEVNAHIKQLADKTNEQLIKLDTALEKELTKSLSSLGSQLTSLSKQFVDDYTPLTSKLRELIQATRVN